MDKKSKVLIGAFVVVVFISIFLTYKRAFIDRDFEVMNSESESVFQ